MPAGCRRVENTEVGEDGEPREGRQKKTINKDCFERLVSYNYFGLWCDFCLLLWLFINFILTQLALCERQKPKYPRKRQMKCWNTMSQRSLADPNESIKTRVKRTSDQH